MLFLTIEDAYYAGQFEFRSIRLNLLGFVELISADKVGDCCANSSINYG